MKKVSNSRTMPHKALAIRAKSAKLAQVKKVHQKRVGNDTKRDNLSQHFF